ncbi:hypothetical protein [Burkholderia cepacia]|uniref:hypothetical protein n=1 Tax=Burkholderia cepacia TaxID=292 RepID=UPI000ACD2A30|nr:hypothetical protein [Burkholderia cepacia]
MKSGRERQKRKQSNLSRALASSNNIRIVHDRFFRNLNAGEIRRSTPTLTKHRHFSAALHPNRGGASRIYTQNTPKNIPLEKCIAWCLGLLESHKTGLQYFLDEQEPLLKQILAENYGAALLKIEAIENVVGLSSWGVSLKGTLLSLIDVDARHNYLTKIITESEDNGFFKALAFNLTNRFDDLETLQSESRFFEMKIKRSFVGVMLHFLMYKLVPLNVEFDYDFEKILDVEKESSAVDVFQCLMDFLVHNLHSTCDGTAALCRRVIVDLRRNLQYHALDNLAVAWGVIGPPSVSDAILRTIDLYTAGDYEAVCERMRAGDELLEHFGLVEIWAKALSRLSADTCKSTGLSHILGPLRDVLTKSSGYEKSRATLLAYCHALGMFKWFRELRYLLERETRFYDATTNEQLRQTSLLLSSLTTPAKAEVLARRGYIENATLPLLITDDSVTARLFNRMRSSIDEEPTGIEMIGIDATRQVKFRASWNLARHQYAAAIPLLETLLHSDDVRVAQDASRALVEAYRSTGAIERAADVYVEAVLGNANLLSIFDSTGLAKACGEIIKGSCSISIPIVFSIHSRYIGDAYDAALKYSFECFLQNNGRPNPIDVARLDGLSSSKLDYFLRYVCTPEVMKLYLYFDGPKDIELCRVEICKLLLDRYEGDEELIFEVKERTRRLVLRDAVNHVQGGRIFSDANLLTGAPANAFKALFERYSTVRAQDFSSFDDEITLCKFLQFMKGEELLLRNAHTIHVQDIVLNEKNSVFMKLVKLARDQFAFGEKGLNVYLSTRIRHGHFPNTIRKPLLDNSLLASKATDTASYKMNRDWQEVLKPKPKAVGLLEQEIVEFSVKLNELVDEVNDNWLRIFTIDQDISGLGKDGEANKSLFNYSVTAVEAYYLQSELGAKALYTDFVAAATRWLWERTEGNLGEIRHKIAEEMRSKAISLLEELGKQAIHKCGIESLGDFPDALARARAGLMQAFDTVQGWFVRARGATIPSFDLGIPVQIASMSLDLQVEFKDDSGLCWNGGILNPFVDAFYILFENAVSKSGLHRSDIVVAVEAKITDGKFVISIENNCAALGDVGEANAKLERYRDPANFHAAVDVAQGEGGSGFFKLWRLLDKDVNVRHLVTLGYSNSDRFMVGIEIPFDECEKVCINENSPDRGRRVEEASYSTAS